MILCFSFNKNCQELMINGCKFNSLNTLDVNPNIEEDILIFIPPFFIPLKGQSLVVFMACSLVGIGLLVAVPGGGDKCMSSERKPILFHSQPPSCCMMR